MPIGSHNMLTTAYGSPTCSDTMHVYAMTGALTQAATTFVDATAEAHSGCTHHHDMPHASSITPPSRQRASPT